MKFDLFVDTPLWIPPMVLPENVKSWWGSYLLRCSSRMFWRDVMSIIFLFVTPVVIVTWCRCHYHCRRQSVIVLIVVVGSLGWGTHWGAAVSLSGCSSLEPRQWQRYDVHGCTCNWVFLSQKIRSKSGLGGSFRGVRCQKGIGPAEMAPWLLRKVSGPHPQYDWDFPEEILEEIPERPRKRSQSFSWNFPREYGWDAPSPIIQGIWGFQSVSNILSPPSTAGDASFSELVPKRASQSWSWNSQQYWGYFWVSMVPSMLLFF